jgi:hypothetical protein
MMAALARACSSVAALGVASIVLYTATYAVQRRIAFGPLAVGPPLLYVAITVASFLVYGRVLALASAGALDRSGVRRAIVFPIVVSALLTVGPPSFSIDVWSYLGHGYQASVGANPYQQPVRDIAASAYGAELIERGWIPVHGRSPYGPVWTWAEIAAGALPASLDARMIALKSLVTAAGLLSGGLIWLILGRVAPSAQLAGTLAYLWNPVIVMEFAGEGHNESLIVAAVIASLYFCVRGSHATGIAVLLIGALVKATAAVVLPPQVVFGWRRTTWRSRHIVAVAAGGSLAVMVAALLYWPLWIGWQTFDGLAAHGRPSVLASTPGVLFWYLTRSHSVEASAQLVSLLSALVLAAVAVAASLRAVDGKGLLKASAVVAVAYLMTAPGYWPWYATLPVALLALAPDPRFTAAAVVISFAARIAAPLERLRINGLLGWNETVIVTTIVGLWIPALILAALAIRAARTSAPGVWRRGYGRTALKSSNAS